MKTGTDETGKTRGIVRTKATGARKGNKRDRGDKRRRRRGTGTKGNRRTERKKEQGEE